MGNVYIFFCVLLILHCYTQKRRINDNKIMDQTPSKWIDTHNTNGVRVSGLKISISDDSGAYRFLADHPILFSKNCYFEVEIERAHDDAHIYVDVGVIPKYHNVHNWSMKLVFGFNQFLEKYKSMIVEVIAYEGGGGRVFNGGNTVFRGPKARIKDVIGCGFDKDTLSCFFMLNGQSMGDMIKLSSNQLAESMYPFVSLSDGTAMNSNFGARPFSFKPKWFLVDCSLPTKETINKTWMAKFNNMGSGGLFCDYLNDAVLESKDGERIGCHRLILSLRSDVFKAMFEPEKKTENPIQMVFHGTTIQKMIRFIYTDKIDGEDSAWDMDLLTIAHQYQIKPLQQICEEKLMQSLDADNVLDAWMSSNLLGAKILNDACESYIYHNWHEIKKSEAFQQMHTESKPEMILVIRLFERCRSERQRPS